MRNHGPSCEEVLRNREKVMRKVESDEGEAGENQGQGKIDPDVSSCIFSCYQVMVNYGDVHGYLAHTKPPPVGPYSTICLGSYGGPRRGPFL